MQLAFKFSKRTNYQNKLREEEEEASNSSTLGSQAVNSGITARLTTIYSHPAHLSCTRYLGVSLGAPL